LFVEQVANLFFTATGWQPVLQVLFFTLMAVNTIHVDLVVQYGLPYDNYD